jgi:hypothetical protein
MQGTQPFAYAAPLTTNPFFLGITTDSTLTGYGSEDSQLHVVSSGSSGLIPVIGVDELIFDKSTVFYDVPMEDGKRIFHINYQVDVQAAAYINANIGVEFSVVKFHLPVKYINAHGVPIGYCDSKFAKYGEGDCAIWQPRLLSDGNFWIFDYVNSQTDFTKLYIISDSYLYAEYLNGIITLEFMIPQQGEEVNNNGIIKASKIISDNSLTLRRSFHPYLYFAKAYKEYHSDSSNLDYWGVSFGLDASTDDFKALPLGLEVDYLHTNFGLEITRIVSGSSVGSYWSAATTNTDPIVYLGNRQTDWQANRYTDNNGNACLVVPAEQFSSTQQHVEPDADTPYCWLYCSKAKLLRFWFEYSNDNDFLADGENVLQHAYNKSLLVYTKGGGYTHDFGQETVDNVPYYYMHFQGTGTNTEPIEILWKISHDFRG